MNRFLPPGPSDTTSFLSGKFKVIMILASGMPAVFGRKGL
jgi:hypothetical protein